MSEHWGVFLVDFLYIVQDYLQSERSQRAVSVFFFWVTVDLVSLAAVFSIVTQRSSPERCVTILKTAARETTVDCEHARGAGGEGRETTGGTHTLYKPAHYATSRT